MKVEYEKIMNMKIEELNKKGIKAISFEEAIKDLTPEQLERFLEARKRKFINPLFNMNTEEPEEKRRTLKINALKRGDNN